MKSAHCTVIDDQVSTLSWTGGKTPFRAFILYVGPCHCCYSRLTTSDRCSASRTYMTSPIAPSSMAKGATQYVVLYLQAERAFGADQQLALQVAAGKPYVMVMSDGSGMGTGETPAADLTLPVGSGRNSLADRPQAVRPVSKSPSPARSPPTLRATPAIQPTGPPSERVSSSVAAPPSVPPNCTSNSPRRGSSSST